MNGIERVRIGLHEAQNGGRRCARRYGPMTWRNKAGCSCGNQVAPSLCKHKRYIPRVVNGTMVVLYRPRQRDRFGHAGMSGQHDRRAATESAGFAQVTDVLVLYRFTETRLEVGHEEMVPA